MCKRLPASDFTVADFSGPGPHKKDAVMKRTSPGPSKPWNDLILKAIENLSETYLRTKLQSVFSVFSVLGPDLILRRLRTIHANGDHPVKSVVLDNMQPGMLKSMVSWIAADIWPNVPDPESAATVA